MRPHPILLALLVCACTQLPSPEPTHDGGAANDGGTGDASTADASTADAGTADASTADASTADASTADASTADASTADASTADASTADASTADASTADASTADAGPVDAGSDDAGNGDAGTNDAGGAVGDPDGGPFAPVTVAFVNGSGDVSDEEVFVTAIGRTSSAGWSWIDATGTTRALDHEAANAPGHISKDGVPFANMSFTLSEAANIALPRTFTSARLYVSVGEPLYLAVTPDNQDWAEPDPTSPADPNFGTRFDWYELSYESGRQALRGNTTQAVQFALPLEVTLQQDAGAYTTTRGLTLPRASVMDALVASVPAEFQGLVVTGVGGAPLRVLSPAVARPGALGTYLDAVIDDFWTTHATVPFAYDGPGYSVTGGIGPGGLFEYVVTTDGASPVAYAMLKPRTEDVFTGAGEFTGAGPQGAFLAALNAAFNRGVAAEPQHWDNPFAYYPPGIPYNHYAKVFHDLSIGGLALGFPRDDVNNQDALQVLPTADAPGELRITVRP